MTWKTISASLQRAGELLGRQVWGAELDAAIAIAITELPSVARTNLRIEPAAHSVLDRRRTRERLDGRAAPPPLTLDRRAVRIAGREVWKRLKQERKTVARAPYMPGPVQRFLYRSPALTSRQPYIPTDPYLSSVQTALEQRLAMKAAESPTVPRSDGDLLGKFGPYDWQWLTTAVSDAIGDLAGHHEFNPAPAEAELGDHALLFLVSDWGTGLGRAQKVSAEMKARIDDALAQRNPPDVHVIHLGDVYYAGQRDEYARRFLACWPVAEDDERTCSWNLNGNHDMYSGGHAYFGALRRDGRFRGQRAANDGTSFFRIANRHWQVIGLDTAYVDRKFAEPQLARLADWLAGGGGQPRTILLSHHQLDSVHDRRRIKPDILAGVKPFLDSSAVDVWFWGHEHRCVAYKPMHNIDAPRCIGHGGVPETTATTVTGVLRKIPDWIGDLVSRRRRSEAEIERELTEEHVDEDGERWRKQGFAILHLNDDSAWATYVDEEGTEHWFDGLRLGPTEAADAARANSVAPVKFG